MERQFSIPTDNRIERAENYRRQGDAMNAALLTNPHSRTAHHFPELFPNQKTRILMAVRIYTDATISLARSAVTASDVVSHLYGAQRVILSIYHNKTVVNHATKTKQDIKGNPYEFATEMARDEAKYLVTLAGLTGNATYITSAIAKLDNAITHATEPTAKTLAQFEQAELLHRQQPTPNTFRQMKETFGNAISAARQASNWERAATIGARYAITAARRGHLLEASKGVRVSRKAGRNDETTKGILQREIKKKITSARKQRQWRKTTPPGQNYSHLAI